MVRTAEPETVTIEIGRSSRASDGGAEEPRSDTGTQVLGATGRAARDAQTG